MPSGAGGRGREAAEGGCELAYIPEQPLGSSGSRNSVWEPLCLALSQPSVRFLSNMLFSGPF